MYNKMQVKGYELNNVLLSSLIQYSKEINNNFKSKIGLNYLKNWK